MSARTSDLGYRWGMRRIAVAGLLCFTSGCQVVLGIEEWRGGSGGASASASVASNGSSGTSTSVSASGSGSTSTGGAPCGTDGPRQCVPTVAVFEPEWTQTGMFIDGNAKGCPFQPATVVEVAASIAPQMCACGDPAVTPFCHPVVVTSDNVGCTTQGHLDSAACNFLSGGGNVVSVAQQPADNCSAPSVTPPPVLGGEQTLCAPMADPQCATNEVCVPLGAELCIAHDGVVPCPDGFQLRAGSPFQKLGAYDCSPCIHPAAGCDGITKVFAQGDCDGQAAQPPANGSCSMLPFTAQSFTFQPNPVQVEPCGPVAQKVTITSKTICCL